MIHGYLDGISGEMLCQSTDPAYRHGYRVGRNDDLNRVEVFQEELIERMKLAARTSKWLDEHVNPQTSAELDSMIKKHFDKDIS